MSGRGESFTHVLLTRPRPELDELVFRLETRQLQSIAMPAFDFQPLERSIVPDEGWLNARRQMLVFTSPRAVAFGVPALSQALRSAHRVAALGPATSKALRAAGFEILQAPGPRFDSEALLAALDDEFALDGEAGSCLILTAPGGREALQRGLAARGWQVRLVPVYQRTLLEPAADSIEALENAQRVLSIWTSGAALDHLLDAVSPRAQEILRSGTALVVSERLAGRARGAGFKSVHVAEGPGNDALVRGIEALAY